MHDIVHNVLNERFPKRSEERAQCRKFFSILLLAAVPFTEFLNYFDPHPFEFTDKNKLFIESLFYGSIKFSHKPATVFIFHIRNGQTI